MPRVRQEAIEKLRKPELKFPRRADGIDRSIDMQLAEAQQRWSLLTRARLSAAAWRPAAVSLPSGGEAHRRAIRWGGGGGRRPAASGGRERRARAPGWLGLEETCGGARAGAGGDAQTRGDF
jgi:hypothetical protein